MHGPPALGEGFAHLPYANPHAPRGGRLSFAETGGFDSLNGFLLRGRAPWPLRVFTVESLLVRSWDEPFTLYAGLAERVEVPADRSWVRFTLDPRARFSDGSPVTVADVIWSFETLGREGHPRYRAGWEAIASMEETGAGELTIRFSEANRELPLIMGLRPVLKAGQWAGRAFGENPLEAPIGSGPYRVAAYEPGRSLTLRADQDWWARDLPVYRGVHNADELRFDYFLNGDAVWSAVATGAVSLFAEGDPVRWAEGYAPLPAVAAGRLRQVAIPHDRPSGMEGFVFNTRRPPLDDRRVREALALAFDWEWANARIYRGAYARTQSYWDGSVLAFEGPADGRERALLMPFAETLPEGTLETGWRPDPAAGGRRALRRAGRLLDAAGWRVEGAERRDAAGQVLALEVVVQSDEHETLASLWARSLARIGVALSVRRVDAAQFAERRRGYDFDITVNRWSLSLSPGTEQWLYFGSRGVSAEGTRNYMGADHPAIDAMIRAILAAEGIDPYRAAVRALDRVLSSGIYVVPFGHLTEDRVAATDRVAKPARDALYGFRPETWWVSPD
ncbi:MAG: extracellular solute-binding protein [Paracoccaceae bacterium]